MSSDPDAVLAAEIPSEVRATLPIEILEHLEQPIDEHGDFEVNGVAPGPGDPPPARGEIHTANLDGRFYDAYPAEGSFLWRTTQNAPISGLAIDDRIVIRKSPARWITEAEVLEAGLEVIPVRLAGLTGDRSSSNAPKSLLRIGSKVLRPSSETLAGVIATQPPEEWPEMVDAESGFEITHSELMGMSPGDDPVWTTGTKNVLVIRVDFTGDIAVGTPTLPDGAEITKPFAVNLLGTEVDAYFDQTSYGKAGISITEDDVTEVITLPEEAQDYAETLGPGRLRFDAAIAAINAGVDVESYDRIIVVHSDISNDNPELRTRVEALFAGSKRPNDFLECPRSKDFLRPWAIVNLSCRREPQLIRRRIPRPGPQHRGIRSRRHRSA